MVTSTRTETNASEHRHRLLEAMSQVVADKGYAEVTIADLAAEARVSRRTFYEHFSGKQECLIALYEAASEQALSVLRTTIDPRRDWHTRVEQALGTYLSVLSANPALLSTVFIAILGLGPEGLAARRRANQQLAEFILQVVNAPTAMPARKKPLAPAYAMAIVGAVHELILQAIEDDRAERLPELTTTAANIARAVIDGAQ